MILRTNPMYKIIYLFKRQNHDKYATISLKLDTYWRYAISKPTGQWSEPYISGRIKAFRSTGWSEGETI